MLRGGIIHYTAPYKTFYLNELSRWGRCVYMFRNTLSIIKDKLILDFDIHKLMFRQD